MAVPEMLVLLGMQMILTDMADLDEWRSKVGAWICLAGWLVNTILYSVEIFGG